ncbi:hypothetical protein J6590_030593 [Homalodisca vitripennis]|nr:hypothetical protein J6590_030593 [Homalodisca vitripennis]
MQSCAGWVGGGGKRDIWDCLPSVVLDLINITTLSRPETSLKLILPPEIDSSSISAGCERNIPS